ncbi:maltodextrin glucosidase [Vibrio cidicii]|uniref:maltodextrin glucosidase n=1 Tax=Vibrio cidicii TaxID=1763883 RepID=UPI0018C2D9A5|nr:maltodextrin glucosidase [Vibrio cidicii]MBG0758973.1 maltodextrin glucosidase [Vibrio cidicii]
MTHPFLFHSQTQDGFCLSQGLAQVTLRTQSQGIEKVYLRHEPDNEEYLVEMQPIESVGALKQWRASFALNSDRDVTQYVFKVLTEDGQYWLDARGVQKRMPGSEYHFKYNAKHQPPAWVKEQVFYQIFPDRFCNGNPDISVKDGEYTVKNGTRPVVAKAWGEAVDTGSGYGGCEFYGGDLAGIASKLDYLQTLGVSALYLNPIFTAPSNHKYDTTDYLTVDPHLGTNQEFAELTQALHQRDMKVILDAVFNHTSCEHPWLDRGGKGDNGAYHHSDSPYRDYYFFDGDTKNYIGWKGIENLPVLNFAHQAVRDYIYQGEDAVIRHWLKAPYQIDGWRFDVIHMLGEGEGAYNNAHYVQAFRQATKAENPQAYVLGEHFFEATKWLQGEQEDGSMNYYGFAHPVRALLAQQDIAYDPITIDGCEFVEWLNEARAKVPWLNQLSQLNQLDSHDTARFITLLNQHQGYMEIALGLLFTYVGTPCLYYGTEVGLAGGQDPDNRRCFPWEQVDTSPWFGYVQRLIQLRTTHPCLQQGAILFLAIEKDHFAFTRQLGEECALVVVNLANHTKPISLPFWQTGISAGQLTPMMEQRASLAISEDMCMEIAPESISVWMVDAK